MAMSRSLGGTSFTRRSPMKISPAVASQPGDEAQRRGLPAARRPDQDGKLLVGNLQGELVHRGDGAELLGHTRQLHPRHLKPSSYYSGIMGKNSRSIRLILYPLSLTPAVIPWPAAS